MNFMKELARKYPAYKRMLAGNRASRARLAELERELRALTARMDTARTRHEKRQARSVAFFKEHYKEITR